MSIRDVIWDSINSYVGFMRFILVLALPMLSLVYICVYISDMIPQDISNIIYISIVCTGALLFTVICWIWMNIIAYLQNNDKL